MIHIYLLKCHEQEKSALALSSNTASLSIVMHLSRVSNALEYAGHNNYHVIITSNFGTLNIVLIASQFNGLFTVKN